MSVILPQSSVKPSMWAIDPGIIAYNCARMGLPMPIFAAPFWGPGGKIYDYSGNRYNGTINGATWTGQGLDFDGTNDYVECDLPVVFDDIPNNDFTIAVRIISDNLPTGGTWERIFDARKDDNNYAQMHTQDDLNELGFTIKDAGTGRNVESGFQLSAGVTYDLVGTWKASTNEINFYVDGRQCSGNSDPGFVGNQEKLYIGARTGSSAHWEGPIFYFYIFPACFTQAQVTILRNNPYGMFEPIRSPAIWSIPAVGVAPTSVFYGPLTGSLGGPI